MWYWICSLSFIFNSKCWVLWGDMGIYLHCEPSSTLIWRMLCKIRICLYNVFRTFVADVRATQGARKINGPVIDSINISTSVPKWLTIQNAFEPHHERYEKYSFHHLNPTTSDMFSKGLLIQRGVCSGYVWYSITSFVGAWLRYKWVLSSYGFKAHIWPRCKGELGNPTKIQLNLTIFTLSYYSCPWFTYFHLCDRAL